MKQDLENTIKNMSLRGKGILAADESTPTITKRFNSINIAVTEENRRAYREMLFTTPNLAEYINGVILYEETLGQSTANGVPFPMFLKNCGIIPGIKVDKGLVNLPNSCDEKITQGLDGLAERLTQYKQMGAAFAKWRAVFDIDDVRPSMLAIKANAECLARYAAICQNLGIVPIVEPELLMDTAHTIERCREATDAVLHEVFTALHRHHVMNEYIILKPSMVISGKLCPQQADVDTVATATVETLLRNVPASVPTINFLSGGQSSEVATMHLHRMNALFPNLPWNLSFSYGRALQDTALKAWQGKAENIAKGQQELFKRSKLNSLAAMGEYNSAMEKV